ncbi:MAG: heavy metal translocating P-type ATPase [Spirochaetes bacterium]|nr:heavy metal translocating P-type ATPase [Spirochaetota bacterium]
MRYILKNIDCLDCAVKIEKSLINSGIKDAKVDFKTSSLITSETNLSKIREIVSKVEDEVVVLETDEDDRKDNHILKALINSIPFILTIGYGILNTNIQISPILDYTIVFIILLFGGYRTFLKAFRKIKNRDLFDENFLVSLATISAIAINETFEGLLLITLFNIGTTLEEIAVSRARSRIQKSIQDNFSKVRIKKQDGVEAIVDAEDVEVGEIILVKPGERIILDGEVVKGSAFVDKSAITGEPLPQSVSVGDKVVSGSISLDGVLEIRVSSKFKETTLHKILEEIESDTNKTKTERFVSRLSKIYTPSVIVVGLFVASVIPIILGSYDFKEWIYRGLVIIVISCPCAIAISVPLTYFRAVGLLAVRNILLKNTSSIDKLSDVRAIFFDKTGTLTEGVMKVKSIRTAEGVSEEELISTSLQLARQSNHIISKSIVHNFKNINSPYTTVKSIKEMPGYGVYGIVNGEEVMIGNDKILHKNNIPHNECAKDITAVCVVRNGKYLGFISFDDTLREEAKDVFNVLRQNGIEDIFILTGDNERSAKLIEASLKPNKVFYELSPKDKSTILEEYKSKYKKPVAYVGDGINDSMVMLKSDVGISFNTPVNSILLSSSDVIINSPRLERVLETFLISKNTRKVIIQNIVLALSVKIGISIAGVFGFIPLWLAVLSDTGLSLITVANSLFRDFSKHRHSQAH